LPGKEALRSEGHATCRIVGGNPEGVLDSSTASVLSVIRPESGQWIAEISVTTHMQRCGVVETGCILAATWMKPKGFFATVRGMRAFGGKRYRLGLCLTLCLGVGAVSCPAQTDTRKQETGTIFDFHNGFWINLHHFLYWQALSAAPIKSMHPLTLNQADAEEQIRLTPQERTSWDSAVAYYTGSLIQRDLLFDEGMEAIKNKLEDAETSAGLADVQIPAELRAVLLRAAPIYRKHWWPSHETQNRRWIAQLKPLIEMHGESIRRSLVKIYEIIWPRQPVRIDTVVYANWAGAYTTLEPTRPTISTTDPGNQGHAALEIVFHESSHGMMDEVIPALESAEQDTNSSNSRGTVRFRRDLWHEVLFFTSGQLVADCIPDYVPFADKNGLWTRAWPGPDRALIEQDWKPHMNGNVGLQPALAKLVRDLALAEQRN
jgi:hypothetical protein